MCLWERYLIVALPTEEDFKDIFGKETLVEKDTEHVCTTGSIQVFSKMAILFSDEVFDTSNSGIPSAKFVAKKGPVIMYNVDTAVLSIVAKVQELNAKGLPVPRG
jgi:hypothetical protein